MKTLPQHYSELLGLDDSWRVTDVDLDLADMQVRIGLETTRNAFCCSACGAACPLKDHAPQRQWRHLDTMQFETILIARVPRTNCPDCGVKTCEVPWAEPHGRFTLMFEAFAIRVLQAAASVERNRSRVGISLYRKLRI